MSSYPNATGRILDAAERLFAEHGYEGTSMNTVAKAAYASKANLFHHFGTKDGLYQAVLERLGRERHELIKSLCCGDEPKEKRLDESLQELLQTTYRDLLDHPAREHLFVRELLAGDTDRTALLARAIEEGLLYETEQIKAAQAEGVIRDDIDPMMIPLLIHGAHLLHNLTNPVMRSLDNCQQLLDPDHYLKMLNSILLTGLKPHSDKDAQA